MCVHGNATRWLSPLALGMTLAAALTACGGSGAAGGSATGGGTAATSAPPSVSAASAGGSGGGQSSAPSAAAGTSDPCQVVTAADASRLTGKKLTQAGDTKAAAARICTYTGGRTVVIVTVAAGLSGVTAAAAQSNYHKAVQSFSSIPGVTLTQPGIGDKSLAGTYSAGGLTDTAIAVLKGNVYLSIQATTHVAMASMKALATTALGRV